MKKETIYAKTGGRVWKILEENKVKHRYGLHTKLIVPLIRGISEAKKEVLDDIDKLIRLLEIDLKIMLKKEDKSACNKLSGVIEELKELKKRHLSTFQKEKQHNSGLKKDHHQ